MSDEAVPAADEIDSIPPRSEDKAECLRCHLLKPVDEDGFCASCAKAIEQACL